VARPVVAIAHQPGADGTTLLGQALALSGFREMAKRRIDLALEARGACAAIIVPALDAFAKGSPAATDPRLVEHLLDMLFDLGVTDAAVGSTRGTADLWLENRDVFMVADLLGYRYETSAGHPYEVIDLSEEITPHAFAPEGPLGGTGLSRVWLEAELRLVFSANRTDEDEGYGLCLTTLLGVLPATDKDYQYRYRRDPGEVVAELVAVAPPHFALIDATLSGHGAGGARSPIPLRTDTVIACADPALADYVGALKMGLDPYVSPLATRCFRRQPALADCRIIGPLKVYPDWINVSPALMASTAARRAFPPADRSLRPMLQQVDRALFPFREPANAWLNTALADVMATTDASPGGASLLTFFNALLGEWAKAGEAWSVMFQKDALRQREASINIGPEGITEADYNDLAAQMVPQSDLLRGIAPDSQGIRWRFDDGAVVFDGARRFPIPFSRFAGAVDIHRVIQFMNDYIGGQALVTARDGDGRPIRQIERNLYLPQPNYTALGGGVVIDVTKIETLEYHPGWQRMVWKTVKSENQSAAADDGVVTFEALGDDTLVTIWGRQHFRLPAAWAALDASLDPTVKRALVSEAYARFFQRTFANLEAVAEGRDVRIGKPWREETAGEPLPVERLAGLTRRLSGDGGFDLGAMLKGVVAGRADALPAPIHIDADGFRHFDGAALAKPTNETSASPMAAILRDLGRAARIDAGESS
jgi:uncharacterized protein (DUF362 family)